MYDVSVNLNCWRLSSYPWRNFAHNIDDLYHILEMKCLCKHTWHLYLTQNCQVIYCICMIQLNFWKIPIVVSVVLFWNCTWKVIFYRVVGNCFASCYFYPSAHIGWWGIVITHAVCPSVCLLTFTLLTGYLKNSSTLVHHLFRKDVWQQNLGQVRRWVTLTYFSRSQLFIEHSC